MQWQFMWPFFYWIKKSVYAKSEIIKIALGDRTSFNNWQYFGRVLQSEFLVGIELFSSILNYNTLNWLLKGALTVSTLGPNSKLILIKAHNGRIKEFRPRIITICNIYLYFLNCNRPYFHVDCATKNRIRGCLIHAQGKKS